MSKILIDEVIVKLLLEYVESVPDDRYAVEHIDQDKLVAALKALTSVPDWASEAKEQPAQQEPCKTCKGTGEVETGIGMMMCDDCHGITYTTPQPAPVAKPHERKPLTREQVKGLMTEAGYDTASPQQRADFINGIRHGEAAHGIKEKNNG